MENILSIFVKAIFVENMVFAFFFGMCSYIAVSKSVKTAMGLGIAVTFVMVMTVPLNYLLNEYVLSPGALGWVDPKYGVGGSQMIDLSFLSFIVFIAVIASFVQLVEMVVEKFTPTLYNQLGIFLPAHCRELCDYGWFAVYAGTRLRYAGWKLSAFASSDRVSGGGWRLFLMAAIREKLAYSNVPAAAARCRSPSY